MPGGFRLLTVCAGNIHRSALAEALLRRWSDWYLPPDLAAQVLTESAGLVAPDGAPMGPRTLASATALGADGSAHRARSLTDEHVRSADLVLTATVRQRDTVLSRVPGALRYTFTIREAGRIAAGLPDGRPTDPDELKKMVATLADSRSPASKAEDDDIVDPQGRGDDVHLEMVAQAVPSLTQLAMVLLGMPRAEAAAYVQAVQDAVIGDGEPGP